MMTPEALFARFCEHIEASDLKSDHRLLVAYSGGLDSSVLVDLFVRYRAIGGPDIELIHIDHGMRPDSGEDAEFCRQQAHQMGVPITVETLRFGDADIGHQQARNRRLAAFGARAITQGIDHIATGHHGDDRIESFLFHLRRGTGLDGLAPMTASAPFAFADSDLRVLRPLNDVLRADLEAYADEHSLTFRTDPTNATDTYRRNQIRHHLVPKLATDDNTRRTILSSIEHLDDERKAADAHARDLAESATIACPGLRARCFCRSTLSDSPRATVARLFHHLEPALDARAFRRIFEAIEPDDRTAPYHLTLSGCVITVVGDRVVYEPSEERGARDVLQRCVEPVLLKPFCEGSVPFFDRCIHWTLVTGDKELAEARDQSAWSAEFDPRQLPTPLRIQGPKPGAELERRHPQGDRYHQQLTKIFREYQVDADLRWRWPCLYDADDRLLWAAGLLRGAAAPIVDKGRRWLIEVTQPAP